MPQFTTTNGRTRRSPRVVKYDPNDRLERLGPQAVKDAELLGYAIDHPERAEMILNEWPKENLIDMDLEAVCRLGVSRKKAKVLIAAFELARRSLHKGLGVVPVISTPGDSLHYLADIKDEQREHFVCLYLNARNQIVHKELTSIWLAFQCHRPPPRGVPAGRRARRRVGDPRPQSPLWRRVALTGRPQPHAPVGAGR